MNKLLEHLFTHIRIQRSNSLDSRERREEMV